MALTKVSDAGLSKPASDLQDNDKITLGTGNDFELIHDGSNSYIQEDGTGQLILRGWAPQIQAGYSPTSNRNSGELAFKAVTDGAVELYHNAIKTFETDANGAIIIGPEGGSANLYLYGDEGDDNNDKFVLIANDGEFTLQNYTSGSWEKNIECNGNGNVELYHDNSKKFETTADGVQVTGKIFSSSHLDFADDVKLLLGTGDDLQIWHDGTSGTIDNDTGYLKITASTADLYLQSDSDVWITANNASETMAKFTKDASVELYHNNVKRLETTDAGIKITGQSKGVCTQNLIHNGSMLLSQRGHFQSNLSGAANGFHIDRWKMVCQGVNENPTMLKHDLTNAEAPWDEGFRYSLLLRNGDQTGGGGAGDFMFVRQIIEARNLRHSGWSFKDPNSFVTLSFWVKSSVAQNFYGFCKTNDGTAKLFPWETGTLSANTWTKVIVTMPGNSDISFDENNGAGMELNFAQFYGTNYTHPSDPTYNQWNAWDSGKRALNYGTAMDDWYETNDAEYELTGVQLEVGKVANSYKFQSYHEIMLECKRYYHLLPGTGTTFANCFNGCYNSDTELVANFWFPNEMRGSPSFEYGTALSDFDWEPHDEVPNNLSLRASNTRMASIQSTGHTDNNRQGHAAVLTIDTSAGYVAFYNDY